MYTYTRKPGLIFTDMDGEVVMMSIQHDAYFGVEGAGTRIWELLESPVSVDTIVDALVAEFEVSRSICRDDVEAFISQLEEHQLVSRSRT